MEIGLMTKQMVKEHLFIKMELNTKASGRTISKMGWEHKPGQMGLLILESINKEKSMEKGL